MYWLRFSSVAATSADSGCEAKRQDIEQQLRYVRENGNDHRTVGLKKALSEVNAHCTDEKLRAEREADVRPDKISKKQRKPDGARAELDEAKEKLTQ
ncbi:DUF1090 domain-containing protein [Enterobacter hormaechei]|uniref:DUF1090 domain-containing protein n=1 Tax=Enterobacter hormaechei TaxID=158836 RepID=UPI0013D087C4|nr:DUF1090 domain-containing protein [Enterobacter hormaechei]ELV3390526.1 DUF1090 domain-containing protein [Enterobacter hormaechei]